MPFKIFLQKFAYKFKRKVLKNSVFLLYLGWLFFSKSIFAAHVSQEASQVCHLNQVNKMISNMLPGEDVLVEKMLINCIRVTPKSYEPILKLAEFIEKQVLAGEKPPHAIQKSVALISQAYVLEPNHPKVRYAMAHLLNTIGQYEESQNLYISTLQAFPNAKETYFERAKTIVEKDPEIALNLILQSLKLGMDIDDVLPLIITYVDGKEDTHFAPQRLIQVANKLHNHWLFHKLGLLYLEEKKYQLAAQAFHQAIVLGNSIESKLQLAIIQYRYLKDYKKSIINFESLLTQLKANKYLSSHALALVYSHYSVALFLGHHKKQASYAAIEVAKRSFENREYIQSLLYEYKFNNALTAVKSVLEMEVANDPTYDIPYVFLSEIYQQRHNYIESLELIEKAIVLKPNNDNYYAIKGVIYYKMGDYQNALDNYDKALALNPGVSSYLYNKSCIFARLGQKKESLAHLKMALLSNSSYAKLAKNDSDFNSLRADINFSKEFDSLLTNNYDNQWVSKKDNLTYKKHNSE